MVYCSRVWFTKRRAKGIFTFSISCLLVLLPISDVRLLLLVGEQVSDVKHTEEFGLQTPDYYNYLNQGRTYTVDGMDDNHEFQDTWVISNPAVKSG